MKTKINNSEDLRNSVISNYNALESGKMERSQGTKRLQQIRTTNNRLDTSKLGKRPTVINIYRMLRRCTKNIQSIGRRNTDTNDIKHNNRSATAIFIKPSQRSRPKRRQIFRHFQQTSPLRCTLHLSTHGKLSSTG